MKQYQYKDYMISVSVSVYAEPECQNLNHTWENPTKPKLMLYSYNDIFHIPI